MNRKGIIDITVYGRYIQTNNTHNNIDTTLYMMVKPNITINTRIVERLLSCIM